MSRHEHALVPESPVNGERFRCDCGYTAEFVVLDDGLPGEWVETTSPTTPARG